MADLVTCLTEHGVASLDAVALGIALSVPTLETLQDVWDRLPLDPYLPASPTTRRRRHARFEFNCATSTLRRLPEGDYYQSRADNRIYGGEPRKFAPIDATDLTANPVIEELILRCAAALPVPYERVHIHCHLMRTAGVPEQPGEASPEGIHRDGFDYVSLHMIKRTNLQGAQSIVVDGDMMIVAAPILMDPLDTLVIDDRRYLHAALPFFVREGVGYRDMILCSYQEQPEG